MDKKFQTVVDNTYVFFRERNTRCNRISFSIEKFTIVGVDVKGVLVCDKSGLVLTSKTFLFTSSQMISFTSL